MLPVMEDQFEVEQDENGKWRLVDTKHAPNRYRLGLWYGTQAKAEAVAARFNLIVLEDSGEQ